MYLKNTRFGELEALVRQKASYLAIQTFKNPAVSLHFQVHVLGELPAHRLP